MSIQKSRILTQSSQPIERLARHRKAAGAFAVVSMLGMVAAFAIAPAGNEDRLQLQTVVEHLAVPAAAVLAPTTGSYLREESVQRGDTLGTLLGRLGITDPQAFDFIRVDQTAATIARQLRPGKTVAARTDGNGTLLSLYFPINGKDAYIAVERGEQGLSAHERTLQLESRTVMASGEISHSLFGATDAAGIPDAVATQLADIFGADIDFYRDLRKGDRFSVVYETLFHEGQPLRSGRILAAEFVNDQRSFKAFWYVGPDGRGGYYGADGKSLRKAFLRSPLEFSRVTSGFTSSRFHPILQAWRAHKGVDYGAPVGAHVRSVADGVVEFAGRQGGYGNLLVIRHQGAYSTAYGHLNGFAPGIRQGSRVSQGDVIAYVGQTGLATGPHLHYEFRVHNQQVNPLAVALPTALPLDTAQLQHFRANTAPLGTQLELAKQSTPGTLD